MPRYPKRDRAPLPNELKPWVNYLKNESEKTGKPYAGLTTNKSVITKYKKNKTSTTGNTQMREQEQLREPTTQPKPKKKKKKLRLIVEE